MKLTPLNIISNLKQGNCKAILSYGPDYGRIKLLEKEISKALGLEKVVYQYSDLDIETISSILKTMDMFAPKQLICIADVPNSISLELKKLLEGNLSNLVMFIASEMPTNSSMRKFFEAGKNLASIPCYVEDARSLIAKIKSKIGNRHISKEAIDYLSNNLLGDSLFLENEIEKLLLYIDDKPAIELDDVLSVISGEIISSPDKLCIAFVSGDHKTYIHELSKLFEENISPVWVIRALIRYYLNMYFVKRKISEGVNLEIALRTLTPPIFFKYLPSFKANLAKYDIKMIRAKLSELYDIEAKCKSTGIDAKNLCEMIQNILT